MPRFQYKAADAAGNQKTGVLDALNRVAALAALKDKGLHATSISEVATRAAPRGAAASRKSGLKMEIKLPSFFRPRIKRKQLTVFIRQLATLIDAGVPLLRALNILHAQEKHPTLKAMVADMSESVEGGSTFADALGQHPKVVDKLFVNMVKAGEVGGVLEVVLNRLAEFTEKAERIKTKVKGAMIYPIVVLIVALAILGFMMVFIIPQFDAIFSDLVAGQELPLITQAVVGTSEMIMQRFPVVIAAIVGFIVLIMLIGKSKTGRFVFDVLKLKTPIVSNLISKVIISRFARTLGTLMTSGVQVLQALAIVRDTAGNMVIARAIQKVHDSVKEGETFADPMQASGVFPGMVVSMITVGEETGRLPDMLMKVADTYDGEVDAAVEGLTSIIEPLLIVMLAGIVAVIVVAMFLPLISILEHLR